MSAPPPKAPKPAPEAKEVLEIIEDEVLRALEAGVSLPDYFTVQLDMTTPIAIFPNTEELIEVAGHRVRVVLEGLFRPTLEGAEQ